MLGCTVDTWDVLIVHILFGKLHNVTAREWQNQSKGVELPVLEEFVKFIRHRTQTLKWLGKSNVFGSNTISRSRTNKRETFSHVATTQFECNHCSGSHSIYLCRKILKLTVQQRHKEIWKRGLCTNCLRTTRHHAGKCTSSGCKTCSSKHNTLLHFPRTGDNQVSESNSSTTHPEASANRTTVAVCSSVSLKN